MVRVPNSLVIFADIRVTNLFTPYIGAFCLRNWMGTCTVPNLVSRGGGGVVGEGIRFEPKRNHGF